jgi:hypothetical protein
MKKKRTGSGAATSSGVNYQNRVAAYLLATSLCERSLPEFGSASIRKIGFETTEAVDDLNIQLENGTTVYLQIKRNLSFSTSPTSELHSVLRQFAKQFQTTSKPSQMMLVTTTDSSARVTGGMRAALNAFRNGDEDSFRRDQPLSIKNTIHELQNTVGTIVQGSEEARRAINIQILQKISVWALDLEAGSSLEQAIVILLQSRGFISPDLLWGKLIADCVNHSSLRHTVTSSEARARYEKFLLPMEEPKLQEDERLIATAPGAPDLSVGRELVLGRWAQAPDDKVYLFEFYRFDEHCAERLRFENGKCILAKGDVIECIHRAATYDGMTRFLTENPDVSGESGLVIVPINSKQDFENGICVDRWRAIVRNAWKRNNARLKCLHCGKPVSSSPDFVESGTGDSLRVGITHRKCTRADDRVLGILKGEFFERFSYLVNFDAEAWFRAAQRGQGALAHRKDFPRNAVLAWGGRASSVSPGDYLVECRLADGRSVFFHERGRIHRMTRAEAEAAVAMMTPRIKTAREAGDPDCYSDQSRAYGSRSTLLQLLGGSEKLVEIESAEVVPFRQELADEYAIWDNWYAPLAHLRLTADGSLFDIGGFVPLIASPFDLDKFLENWKTGKIEVPDYEIMILESDRQFDDFAADALEGGINLIVDPLVDPTGKPSFVSGIPIRSMQQMTDSRARRDPSASG